MRYALCALRYAVTESFDVVSDLYNLRSAGG
jgi:hypothetical protein